MSTQPPSGPVPITADLRPFAIGPSPVSALQVTCSALPDGVSFAFVLEGRIDALRLPARDAGPDAWPLWRHTCFEAFLSVPGEESYREVNFSPAGLWAGMAFRGYRDMEREITGDGTPPIIATEVKHDRSNRRSSGLILPSPLVGEGPGERGLLSMNDVSDRIRRSPLPNPSPTRGEGPENPALHLTAQLPRALLPKLSPDGPLLQIGLSAVIERTDGQLEYWALRHPLAERADFHHRDGWTLRLAVE